MYKGVEIIAEVKPSSVFESWHELLDLAKDIGDVVSVHTDSRWRGKFSYIREAKKLGAERVLAKGIHNSDYDIRRAVGNGADYVLVVGRVPEVYQDRCWIEPLNLRELREIPEGYKVVWNQRDLLEDGVMKKESFGEARKIWKGWLCQASFLRTTYDIRDGADAVLVGTHLRDFSDSVKVK
jgi:hypothetical protein